MLEQLRPDLVVLDVMLPDGNGLDLLTLLRKKDMHPPVFVVSAHLDTLDPRSQSAAMRTFAKPVDTLALRTAAQNSLTTNGPQTLFSVAEFVQLAALGRHSVELDCKTEWGLGRVVLYNGEVWSAQIKEKTGFTAFSLLVRAGSLTVDIRPCSSEPGSREITGSWQELLFEAARLEDEAAAQSNHQLQESELDFSDLLESELDFSDLLESEHDFSDLLSEESSPETEASPSNEEQRQTARTLIQQGVRLVVKRRYADAVRRFREAQKLDPKNPALRHRLQRLGELGFS